MQTTAETISEDFSESCVLLSEGLINHAASADFPAATFAFEKMLLIDRISLTGGHAFLGQGVSTYVQFEMHQLKKVKQQFTSRS
jgi:hypothetical protein